MSISRIQAGRIAAANQDKLDTMYEPAGYPIDGDTGEIDRDSSFLSWDDSTRTLTISPTGDKFTFYSGNIKYESSGASYQIEDIEGLWFFYFDENGEFQGEQTFDLNFIYNQAFTAFIYWDATNKTAIGGVFDERHGAKMDGHTHAKFHEKWGTEHRSGGALTNTDSTGNGDSDSDAQFGIAAAVIYDEDVKFEIDAIASTVGIPILYLEGSTPNLRLINEPGFSITTTGAGKMAFNENVGGTWQISEIANNDFGLCHVFYTSGEGIKGQAFAVMGQNDYLNIVQARQGASTEIKTLLSILPVQEKDWVSTLIFQTSDGYSNGVKARLRENDLGGDWLDWRFYDYKDFTKAVT